MLAGKAPPLSEIKFPIIASPKLDGIRCLYPPGIGPVTRSFKKIPNHYIREQLEMYMYPGLDGEILIPGMPFNKVSSAVMSHSGEPRFKFYVFDYVKNGELHTRFEDRILNMQFIRSNFPSFIELIPQVPCFNVQSLEFYERKWISEGYEGVMIRTPHSPYKEGRSTTREGYLLKIKRFSESEATIIGFEELYHNDNELEEDEFGLAKRSTCQENKVGIGILGALVVKKNNITFKIGTGFSHDERVRLWRVREHLEGLHVTYKHQKSGAKDKPRFPVYKAIREDM